MSSNDFESRLQVAVARHIGTPGTLHDLQRLTGGATKITWSFDADIGATRCPFILQQSTAGDAPVPAELAQLGTRLTSEQDAEVMIAACATNVPAPRVRAVLDSTDGIGHGFVTDRVEGETLGTRILREDRYAKARPMMASQCGKILAGIHSIDLARVPFLRDQDAAQQVAAQRMVVDYYGFRLPALELGLRWAAENAPKKARRTVVHGDFRTGNLIVGEEGIRCVLDWEIAQVGDPMQDLGWVCVKTWRFGGPRPVGGFGAREDLFAAYEAASGHHVDPGHVRFWEAWGSVKWAIGCLRKGLHYVDGSEELSIEQSAIGRRIEEPLWDFLNLIEGRD
jgi:aminoglycoside phosphotransferase (APT) family kinase protein